MRETKMAVLQDKSGLFLDLALQSCDYKQATASLCFIFPHSAQDGIGVSYS